MSETTEDYLYFKADFEKTEKNSKVLIERLRVEANYVKDCFTKFSFWVLGFSCAMLGFIAKYQVESPYVGFTSGLIMMIVFSVSEIGICKYETANRNFGYELHLSRIDTLTENSNPLDEWKTRYLKIGWEEAIRLGQMNKFTLFLMFCPHFKG